MAKALRRPTRKQTTKRIDPKKNSPQQSDLRVRQLKISPKQWQQRKNNLSIQVIEQRDNAEQCDQQPRFASRHLAILARYVSFCFRRRTAGHFDADGW